MSTRRFYHYYWIPDATASIWNDGGGGGGHADPQRLERFFDLSYDLAILENPGKEIRHFLGGPVP